MNIYVELKSLDEIGVLLGAVKTQNIQIYGVEIDRRRGRAPSLSQCGAQRRLEHHQQHPQVLAALSEITGVIRSKRYKEGQIKMLPVFDGLRNITLASVAFRLILSTLCGGIVGMEREFKRRARGFEPIS